MLRAIEMNRVDFVVLLLNNGLNLQECLTMEDLEMYVKKVWGNGKIQVSAFKYRVRYYRVIIYTT